MKNESFGLENPTEREAVAISIEFLMMLCVLVRIDAHWFLIDLFL